MQNVCSLSRTVFGTKSLSYIYRDSPYFIHISLSMNECVRLSNGNRTQKHTWAKAFAWFCRENCPRTEYLLEPIYEYIQKYWKKGARIKPTTSNMQLLMMRQFRTITMSWAKKKKTIEAGLHFRREYRSK